MNNNYPKYLKEISISGLRNWTGQKIEFKFPVSVICGENGSGKSTVLKVAASCYTDPINSKKSFYPSNFFPDSAWDNVSGVKLSYLVKNGNQDISFNLTKPTERWRPPDGGKPKRTVILQDVSRTLPIESTVGYSRLAKRNSNEVSATSLNDNFQKYYSNILGRSYEEAKFAKSNLDKTREVGVVQLHGIEYSQFHQGAGEDATLDLMLVLQNVQNTSLILIDEVEASLHPRAQRRLVHFLLWLSRTKDIQIILTTHSSYILEELPLEARIFLHHTVNGPEVIYGISPNFALNKIDSYQHPDLFIFVEDWESKLLTDELLRYSKVDLTKIKIIEVGPANNVISMSRISNSDGFPFDSISIVDADQTCQNHCLKLPGEYAPEKQIFSDIYNSASRELGVALEFSYDSIRDALSKARAIEDHHNWIDECTRILNNLTKEFLWVNMCRIWCRYCKTDEDFVEIVDRVNSRT